MIDPSTLVAFLPAALALNLLPGSDMMFCLAQGLRGGPRPTIAASAGISAGAMVHVTAAGLGLGALVAAFPVLFGLIRWIGVAYLLWLAWRTLTTPITAADKPPVEPRRAFRDGLIVNLSNPKVVLFILAFVPQFVDPSLSILPQFLAFGAILAIGGFIVNGLVGIFAGGLGRQLLTNVRLERIVRFATATVFGALALRLARESRT
ncbi:LysE family translocator [Aestuariibius sp. 2305UL40-4]|uniref:LysE family translocator n=1 Tax=Aestuariibius violaceus TaxID=3234132 RepID=UPI00345EF214